MNTTVTFKADNRSMAQQVTFALALALTMTGKDAQAESIGEIKQDFTVRNSWYEPSNKFGIKVTPATKANLETSVGTDADWLIPHEVTGIKTPRGKRIALPVIGGARPSFAAKIPKRLLPKNLAQKAIVIETKAGPMLFYRKGRGKRKSLQALYFLDSSVRVKIRSVLFDPVKQIFETNTQGNFNKALDRALSTAK